MAVEGIFLLICYKIQRVMNGLNHMTDQLGGIAKAFPVTGFAKSPGFQGGHIQFIEFAHALISAVTTGVGIAVCRIDKEEVNASPARHGKVILSLQLLNERIYGYQGSKYPYFVAELWNGIQKGPEHLDFFISGKSDDRIL